MESRCDIAYCVRYIGKKAYQDIRIIVQIRNKLAHTDKKIDFSDKEVADLCTKLNSPGIFIKQRGERDKGDLEKEFEDPQQKFNISVAMIVDLIIDDIKAIINL